MFLDGDTTTPTLVGTGAEDYFGTAWGMQHFINQNTGCTIADQKTLHWSCYRLHLPDPIYFHQNLRITIQQIGGGPLDEVRQMAAAGALSNPSASTPPPASTPSSTCPKPPP